MKRIVIAAAALTGLVSPGPAVAAIGEAAALRRDLGPGVRVAEHRETGKVRFVGASAGRPIARPGNLRSSAGAPQVARAFLDRHGAAFGIDDQAEELRVESTHSGAAGRSSVRLQQLRDGIPVLGGELVVNLDGARNVLSASGEVLPGSVPTTPRVSSTAARDAAVAFVAKQRGVSAVRLSATMPELWIYDARLLGGPGPQRPTLVWRLEVKADSALAIDQLMIVDAQRGSVALNIDQIEEAKDRRVCDAENANSDLPCTAPVRVEGQGPVGSPPDVNAAYDFAGETYDFLAGLGRDSLDGNGLPLRSTVRFCQAGCPFQNAFWNGQQMVYGTGFAVDDVVGHELTHGTTDFSAHLFYYYQSGAINESLSDVFGEFVDLTNTAGTDTPTSRWQIGEDVAPGGIRDMEQPGSFGDPDRMTSSNYHPDETDNGGVHINSGVNNKAAFLMTDGATFNGRQVTGLGIPKVSRIYFRVQTAMLTSASDYADLASALPQACAELVGTAGITAADCTEVADAVAAVEMSAVPPLAPASEAAVCDTGLVPTDLFFDDLENTASGNWTAQNGWFYPQNPNPSPIVDATFATSGTTNFFGYDRPQPGEFSIAMNRSVVIPSGPPAFLRFDHAYGFENSGLTAFDGGMLELSTNGGASYSDIGSLLTDGGYNGTLNTGSGNPLAGRSAFVRESNGYVASRATLSSLAGQSVRFRFRIGTDSGNLDNPLRRDIYGWFLDDIRIYTCAPPASTDSDGDGVPNANDACPSVATATSNGCPAPTVPPATVGGATSRPAATLASARLRSCKLSGRSKKARVRCTLRGFRAVRRASVTVKLRGRTVAKKIVRPTSTGVLSLKPLRTLRRGSYRVTIVLRDARGRTRTLRRTLRVR